MEKKAPIPNPAGISFLPPYFFFREVEIFGRILRKRRGKKTPVFFCAFAYKKGSDIFFLLPSLWGKWKFEARENKNHLVPCVRLQGVCLQLVVGL